MRNPCHPNWSPKYATEETFGAAPSPCVGAYAYGNTIQNPRIKSHKVAEVRPHPGPPLPAGSQSHGPFGAVWVPRGGCVTPAPLGPPSPGSVVNRSKKKFFQKKLFFYFTKF